MRNGRFARAVVGIGCIIGVAITLGCSGKDDVVGGATDAGRKDASSLEDAGARTGAVRFTVTNPSGLSGPLAVGAFTENPPKTRPPVVFDTSKTPVFPYSGTLTGLEPGRYWVVAVLDQPPVSLAGLRPGPEDLQVTSSAIDITGGDAHDITLVLPETSLATDAGADASAHD